MNPLLRRCAAPFTGAALVAGALMVVTPTTALAADAPVTTVTNFKTACRANNSLAQVTKIQDTSVIVTAPTQVEPGETFTYRIQSGATAYPNSDSGATTTNISRLKFDFMIPENSTFVSAAVVGSGINLDGVAPNVLRVDESGTPSASGQILRLSGNNQVVGNAPSGGVSTNSEGGIRAPKLKKNLDGTTNSNGDSWFQLPAVDVTVVAGTAGTPIQPKIRATGNAANFNAFENFNTTLPKASMLGTQWANTRCVPRNDANSALNAGAGPLATINVVAAQVSTTTTLSAPATAETGTPVALTAAVAPNGATGSVQFKDNGVNIGAPVTVSGGTASLEHTFTSAGSRSITAVFTGTGNFTGSTSAAQTVAVTDPVVQTTTTVSVPATAATGTEVTLTANVMPTNATGTVQFTANGVNIGAPVSVSNGVATLPHTFTGLGVQAIGAVFTGDAGFTGSTATQTQNVTVTDPDVVTTTTLTVPPNVETGALADLTATVTPATATGSVQFQDNGVNIGAPVTVVNGVATLQHAFSAAGAHSVTATFSGGTGYAGSSAAAQTVTVTNPDVQTATTVTVPAAVQTNQQLNLTAKVSPVPAGGTVQFQVGGIDVGTPVAVGAGGMASLPYTFAAAGSYAVTASYSGTTGFTASAASAQNVTVTDPAPDDIQTSLTVSAPATVETGDEVTFSATVSPSNAEGTVQFSVNGNPVGAAVAVSGGSANLPYTFDAAGTFSVTASFTGAAGFTNSTAPAQSVAVADPDVTTTLEISAPSGATTGQSLTLSATVNPSNALGSVQFSVNGNPIAAPVAVSGGSANLPYTFDAAGTFSLTASFTGAAGFANATASAQSVTVTDPAPVDAATTTILTVPGNAKTGEPEDLYATVYDNTTSDTVPSVGTVEFFAGGVSIGTAPVVDGLATLSHTFTTAGTHTVTATFSGATGIIGSTAAAKQVVVTVPTQSDIQTATVLTVPASAKTGTKIQLSAQVTGVGGAAVTGTVQFFDGENPIGDAVPVINGIAVLEYTFTTTGAHSIRAEFGGGQGVADSISGVQTVQVSGGSSGGGLGSLSAILEGLNFGS